MSTGYRRVKVLSSGSHVVSSQLFLLITFTKHKELVVITKPTRNDSVHSLVASFHTYIYIVAFNILILMANAMEFAMAMELVLDAHLRIEKILG